MNILYYFKISIIIKLISFFILTLIITNNFICEFNKIKNTKVCLCTNGKKENLYAREFVQHYINYGVDKIFTSFEKIIYLIGKSIIFFMIIILHY